MDGDDICFPNRFIDQVTILDKNTNIDLVAGNFEVINQQSEYLYRELVLTDPEDLNRAFFLRNPIAHGSVMFRKSLIDTVGPYSDAYGPTEDLELWMRVIKHSNVSSTGTPVYRWRVNMNGITMSNNSESIRQSQRHIAERWKHASPVFLSRRELLKKNRHYYETDKLHGAYYKQRFMADTSQIAAKMIAKGHVWWGVRQLFVIASTGRTGIKTVLVRIHLISFGRIASFRKKIPFGSKGPVD